MILELQPNVGSTLTIENDGASTGYNARGIDFGNAVWEHFYSGPRGTQGALAAHGQPQNRPFAVKVRVSGSGATAALAKADLATKYATFQKAADNLRRYGGKIRYRSNNGASSQYLRVTEAQLALEELTPGAEANNRVLGLLTATGAPYWEGDALTAMTFSGQSLPAVLNLGTTIPGDSPSLCEVSVRTTGGTSAPIWALLGWCQRPSVHNYIWNGDFESDADGWSVAAAPGGIANAATSIARTTAAALYPVASGQITAISGNAQSGANFAIYRRFRAGVTYSFSVGVQSATSTANVSAILGTATDASGTVPVALSSSWQLISGTWTPAADADVAYIAVRRTSSGAADVFRIDGVQVYEGTTAPTVATQTEGRGAPPPFGLLEAESCDTGPLSTWAITADADYRSGYGLQAAAAGAGTASATYGLDPSLIPRDDYTQGDLSIEVWARVELASTLVSPKLTLSTAPASGASRYSDEWGSAGKLLTLPSSGTRFRFVRLGTLPLISDPSRPVRWDMTVAASWAAGSTGTFGLDYLALVPIRQRLASPSSKANDSAYPAFIPTTADWTKTIRSDGSGLRASGTGTASPDHGLGGVMEFPYGNVDALVKLSSLVADDPTSDATTEQLAHTGSTVVWTVTPRWAFLRE